MEIAALFTSVKQRGDDVSGVLPGFEGRKVPDRIALLLEFLE
jgi:hypothetical protein